MVGPFGASDRKETDVCVKTAPTGPLGTVMLGDVGSEGLAWRETIPAPKSREGHGWQQVSRKGEQEGGAGSQGVPAGPGGCCSTAGTHSPAFSSGSAALLPPCEAASSAVLERLKPDS